MVAIKKVGEIKGYRSNSANLRLVFQRQELYPDGRNIKKHEDHICFDNGYFQTDDLAKQKCIEGHSQYGIRITPVDLEGYNKDVEAKAKAVMG
jgi:hypothetical protein